MRKVLTYILATVFLMGSTLVAFAQGSGADNTFGGVVRLDKIVHDFGDILVTDGPVTATFTATNVGDKPLVIYSVVSSCGCTDVEWTKQPLKPGEKGTIKAEAFMSEIRALVGQILMDCRNVSDMDRLCLKHFEEVGTCPICGNPVLIGSKSYFCSNQDCRFVIWKDLAHAQFVETRYWSVAKAISAPARTAALSSGKIWPSSAP